MFILKQIFNQDSLNGAPFETKLDTNKDNQGEKSKEKNENDLLPTQKEIIKFRASQSDSTIEEIYFDNNNEAQ